VRDGELIMEKAEVLVTISNGELGKVRVNLDNTYIERYAKAKTKEEIYKVGTEVIVIDITEQYLIVSGDDL
jgi:ribosomal protein L19E